MIRTKLSCLLFLLMSVCVSLSQGKIKLYDLMQNSDDDCFDKPGAIYKGKSCYELVEESSGYCYTSIEEFCCLSCSFKKQDVSGCEYGDKSFVCEAKLCGKYDKETRENICCKTCDGVSLKQDPKPSTQKPVTSSRSGSTSKEATETAPKNKSKKPVKTFSFPVLRERKGKRKSSIKHHIKIEREPEPKPSPDMSFDKTADWIDPDPLPLAPNQVETTVATAVDKKFKENYVISHWEDPTQHSALPQIDPVSDTVIQKGSITNSENRENPGTWIDPEIPESLIPVQVRNERKKSPTLSAPDMSSINHLKDTVLSMPSVEVAPEVPVSPIIKDQGTFDLSSIADIPKAEGSSNNDLISPGFDIKPWDSYAAANSEGGVVSGPTASPIIPESNLEKKTVDLTNNPVKILKAPTPEENSEYARKEVANIEPKTSNIPPEEPVAPVMPIPPNVVQTEIVTEPIVYDNTAPVEVIPQLDNSPCGPNCHDVQVAPEQIAPSEETAPIPDTVTIMKEPKKTEATAAVKNILENFVNPNEPNAPPNVEENVLPIIPGPKTLGVSVTVDPLALPVDLETAIVEGISLRDAMIKIPKDALTVNNPVPFNEPSQNIPFFGSQENSLHQIPDVSKIKKNIEILPMEPPSKDNVIPVENTIPVNAVPVENAIIEKAEKIVPPENIVAVENALPVENILPVESVLPVENVLPIKNDPIEKIISMENVPPTENVISVEKGVPEANVIPLPTEKVPAVDNMIQDVIPVEKVANSPSSTINEISNAEKIQVKGSGDVKKTFLVKTIAKPTSSATSPFGVVPIASHDGITIPPPHTVIIQRPMYLPPYAPWFYHSDRNNYLYNPMRGPASTPVYVRKTRHFKIVRTPKKENKVTKTPKVAEPVQPIASWNSLHPPITPQQNMRMFSAAPTKSQSISDDNDQIPSPPIQTRQPMFQRQHNRGTVNQNAASRHSTRAFHSSQIMQPRNSNQQRMALSNSVINQQPITSRNNFNNRHQTAQHNFNHPMYMQPTRLFIHHLHSFNYPNVNNMQHWQNMNSYIQKHQSMNMNHLPFWYNGR